MKTGGDRSKFIDNRIDLSSSSFSAWDFIGRYFWNFLIPDDVNLVKFKSERPKTLRISINGRGSARFTKNLIKFTVSIVCNAISNHRAVTKCLGLSMVLVKNRHFLSSSDSPVL